MFELKIALRPHKPSGPNAQTAQDVLEQTEITLQDVRKNAMQAYLKHKAYYHKNANASWLEEWNIVYVLKPKVDHQGNKIPFTDFRWIGRYIIEKSLTNNNHVERKIGTNKTQFLYCMKLRPAGELLPDMQTTSQKSKLDPQVILKHDVLYARVRESDFEKLTFDND